MSRAHHSASKELTATCDQEQAEQLLPYDHHRVRVNDELGVMLTYPWMSLADDAEPRLLRVVFAYALAHPPAPREIQEIIDLLKFVEPGEI